MLCATGHSSLAVSPADSPAGAVPVGDEGAYGHGSCGPQGRTDGDSSAIDSNDATEGSPAGAVPVGGEGSYGRGSCGPQGRTDGDSSAIDSNDNRVFGPSADFDACKNSTASCSRSRQREA